MFDNDILILKGREVLGLLEGCEHELMQTVQAALQSHARGETSLPQSTFLRFPDQARNRIIALPAYLGQPFAVAGIKWVSSFPGNHERGLDRASAVVVLNSTETGRPEAIIEGSIISAKRTAASAALAALHLQPARRAERVGVIGCGLINFEIVRFLLAACPEINSLMLFDKESTSAESFRDKCLGLSRSLEISRAGSARDVLQNCPLISFATTAIEPHIADLSGCPPGSTLLHISLRDLAPEAVLLCDNVVDDIEHVCRAQTSVHLAAQLKGDRSFIRCTLADVLDGKAPARKDSSSTVVFSPFGLGILDLAVSKLVCERAVARQVGMVINSFLPEPWLERDDVRV